MKMKYTVIEKFKGRTKVGVKDYKPGTLIELAPLKAEPLLKAGKIRLVTETLTFDELFHMASEKGTDIAEILNLTDGYNHKGQRYCYYLERLLSLEETRACRKEKNCVDCTINQKPGDE